MSTFIITIAEIQALLITIGSFIITLHIYDGSEYSYNVFKVYLVFSTLSFAMCLWGEYLSKELEYEKAMRHV